MSSPIPVTLTLPPDLLAEVDRVAVEDGRTRSSLVRRILMVALSDHASRIDAAAKNFGKLRGLPPIPKEACEP